MRRRAAVLALVIAVSLALELVILARIVSGGGIRPHTERVYAFTARTLLENHGNRSVPPELLELNRVELFLNLSWQQAELISIKVNGEPVAYSVTVDEDGNPIAAIEVPSVPPGRRLEIEVEMRIEERLPKPTISRGPEPSRFLGDGGPWQVDDEEIRRLALSLAGNATNKEEAVFALIRWMKENIAYGGKIPPRYPREVLEDRKGDCDEQALLLGTMCRCLGIPAFLQVGAVYISGLEVESKILSGHVMLRLHNIGWHGWAQVYIEGVGWIPVDLTYYDITLPVPAGNIHGAGVLQPGTLVLGNVSKVDYVGQARELERILEEYNVTLIEEYRLELVEQRIALTGELRAQALAAGGMFIWILIIVTSIGAGESRELLRAAEEPEERAELPPEAHPPGGSAEDLGGGDLGSLGGQPATMGVRAR